ncbi:unnamed protein product [Fraxinus pennsylvanica]|uniref:cellulase n=1 Tax=Fraxinus pennsylvanica TaxID=56036 RepID=A0AAD1ZGC5_9LAMI|nr:unnamed protein product [Fraxinus pennsylvanica]
MNRDLCPQPSFVDTIKRAMIPPNVGVRKYRSGDADIRYYYVGYAIKFNFPTSFAMTTLGWSEIEYSAKFIRHILLCRGCNQVQFVDVFCHDYVELERDRIHLAAEMDAALASASIVFKDNKKYSGKLMHSAKTLFKFSQDELRNNGFGIEGGWIWHDSPKPNPNIIIGAMVAGPDKNDGLDDLRANYNFVEPTLAGNAGLVAALVALSGDKYMGIDEDTINYALPSGWFQYSVTAAITTIVVT